MIVRSVLIVVIVGAAISAAAVAVGSDSTAEIAFSEDAPDDFRALAEEIWDDFLAAHPTQQDCIRPVTLVAAWQLESRAEYRPSERQVIVRVPGTAATLSNAMVHEFAHHLEFTCPSQVDLRAAFLKSQGFPASAPWNAGGTWATTPSEQYAEATVELVLGRRPHHGNIHLSMQAIDIVRLWAGGPER